MAMKVILIPTQNQCYTKIISKFKKKNQKHYFSRVFINFKIFSSSNLRSFFNFKIFKKHGSTI